MFLKYCHKVQRGDTVIIDAKVRTIWVKVGVTVSNVTDLNVVNAITSKVRFSSEKIILPRLFTFYDAINLTKIYYIPIFPLIVFYVTLE